MSKSSFKIIDICETKFCKKSNNKAFKIAFGVYSYETDKYHAIGIRWKENPEIKGDTKGYPPTEEGEEEQFFTLPLCAESIDKIIAFLQEYKEKLNIKVKNA
jgi:hypothetical protein